MNLHAAQIQGFFDIPLDHLMGNPLFTRYYMSKFDENVFNHDDFCVVSPTYRLRLALPRLRGQGTWVWPSSTKRRQRANMCEVMNIIGDVEGKTCILYDDIVDTAGSLCNAAEAIKTIGKAKAVYASPRTACSPARRSSASKTAASRSWCCSTRSRRRGLHRQEDPLISTPRRPFAKAITRIYNETSISSLF